MSLPRLVPALLLLALSGCLAEEVPAGVLEAPGHDAPAAPGSLDRDAAGASFEPRAVVALIDDGINPYHEAFRDGSPRAFAHPSTYLPGYPMDAQPVNLTFGKTDRIEAMAADCKEWEKVQPGRLYWFPGTRVVGAIFLKGEDRVACGEEIRDPPLVGWGGHGTMTASRAAGSGYGACPECLIVMVQGFGAAEVTWAAEQPWIDLQSNSWGPFVPVPVPVGTPLDPILPSPGLARAIEAAAQRQPSFWASGNGALTRGGVAGHPTLLQPHQAPSVLMVGGHDSGRVALWPGWGPHVVSDACASWAAEHDDNAESTERTGGGTSGATPYAAGLAAKLVVEARRVLGDGDVGVRNGTLAQGLAGLAGGLLADGALTAAELREALFKTADPRPDRTEDDGVPCDHPYEALWWPTPVAWTSVPEGPAGIPIVGYGAVTKETLAQALQVVLGEAGMPERPDEDAWFARDAQLRQAFHEAYTAAG